MLYRFVRFLVQVVCRTYWRATFEGLEHVPSSGSFVLAPVHRSFIDFGIVSGVTKRRLRYMGKAELWKFRPLGALITALGAFPVRRGAADREAFRRSLAVVEGGEPLVLFPEGTRRSGPVVENLHEGASYVAMRAGIPIVPVGIGGSERALQKGKRLPRPVRVHVAVGPPILPPETGERPGPERPDQSGRPGPERPDQSGRPGLERPDQSGRPGLERPDQSGRPRSPSRRAVRELTEQLRVEIQRLFDHAQSVLGETPSGR